jgi:hypothetical protein
MDGRGMAKFRERFSEKQWQKCCGKGYKKCAIHDAHFDEFGRKTDEKKFAKDHDRMH